MDGNPPKVFVAIPSVILRNKDELDSLFEMIHMLCVHCHHKFLELQSHHKKLVLSSGKKHMSSHVKLTQNLLQQVCVAQAEMKELSQVVVFTPGVGKGGVVDELDQVFAVAKQGVFNVFCFATTFLGIDRKVPFRTNLFYALQ
jgi:hypothetical protein